MQKLINSVQNYAWGSKTALTELYGMENPSSQPMAELWMGAHPKSSSRVQNAAGDIVSLRDVIESDKSTLLGEAVAKRFGELPFLFKVLCAAQPLSIQVHPNKRNSEIGFAKENAAGIPMDAAERNYKDPNHKPELVFALTPFLAMNAFREFSEIVSLLQPVAGAHPAIAHFLQQPDAERLSELFAETPHAYLQGVALEVMANSDNVLRAGLTPKYIDIPELVANVKFEAKPANQLLTQPVKQGAELDFPIPVDDFAFSLHDLSDKETTISQQSAAILFCVEGDATLCKGSQQLQLKPGESAFIAANESPVTVKGHGRLARVYNKL
ncbi:TPA: mannose-6-phosphate isomerase, class I [Escherichia coli]